MTSFKTFLVCAASAAILSACATSTPYQPASTPGGFDVTTPSMTPSLMILMSEKSRNIARQQKSNLAKVQNPPIKIMHSMPEKF